MKKIILAENLETLGEKYESEHLSIWKKNQLQTDSWFALKFFFYHSFMRGRRDKLSVEYYTFTVSVLKKYFDTNNLASELKKANDFNLFNTDNIRKLKKIKRNSIKHRDFGTEVKDKNSLVSILTTEIKIEQEFPKGYHYNKTICLQNDIDLLMVLDTLNFISEALEKQNIYNYFYNLIASGNIGSAHNELIKLSGVGDKLSTFFLRDIAIINRSNITAEQIEFVFPVDTWVAQITNLISGKIENRFSAENPDEIKDFYIKNFSNSNFPLIAAGLWYLGYYSLDFAFNYAKEYKIVNKQKNE